MLLGVQGSFSIYYSHKLRQYLPEVKPLSFKGSFKYCCVLSPLYLEEAQIDLLISRGIFWVLNQILIAADNIHQKAYNHFIPTGIHQTFGDLFQLWQ